jgi:hypothetical protein
VGDLDTEIVGGRYAIFDEIAAGGMASVSFCCTVGASTFSRVLAIKRLHAHLVEEPEFVAMFIDEARVAARIRHPNVVPTLDVVTSERELFLVMEYVHGESLSRLLRTLRRQGSTLPVSVASGIAVGVLHGLHAAHEAVNHRGESLRIVHRDVSPQNVLVGADGIPRVVDFGVAHANGRLQTTVVGQVKGKCEYMAPEYLDGGGVTRAADIYSAGVVLWESLTGRRLFDGETDAQTIGAVLRGAVVPPSRHAQGVSPELDAIVLRALGRDPAARFATAREMARAIEAATPIATASGVGDWAEALAGPTLRERASTLARIESGWADGHTGTHKRRLLEALSGWPLVLSRAKGRAAEDERSRGVTRVEANVPRGARAAGAPPAAMRTVPPRGHPARARRTRPARLVRILALAGVLALPVASPVFRRWLPLPAATPAVDPPTAPDRQQPPLAAPSADPVGPPLPAPWTPVGAKSAVPVDALPRVPTPAESAATVPPTARRHAR